MPSPHRGPNSRPTGPNEADPTARPQIWVEGRQQPRFNLRAWAAVSLTMTRRKLAPDMSAGVARIDGFGQTILSGALRPNLAWAGRAEKLIPSHQNVGHWVTAAARLLAAAREIVLPSPQPAEPIAYPNLIRPNFTAGPARPVRPLRPQSARPAAFAAMPEPPDATGRLPVSLRHPQPDEPTLRAIRSLIDDTEPTGPARPAKFHAPDNAAKPGFERPEPAAPARLHRARAAVAGLIWRAAAHVLAWGLTALIFPVGGINAVLFHLDGGDLHDWS